MSAAATRESAVLDTAPKSLYIGGEWREAEGGGRLAVEDPATGETLVEVADAQPADALAALAAAAGERAARPRRDPAPGVRGDRRAG